ncbi:RNA polymerase sigma factor [Streptomyces coeruleoprunus]|uniref:RNA polymerase sigma factor n=1 Tax=Streptomyces coeruleoprunus TaxID=285563 RepID=A0ABV9XKY8_9ACTN
MTLTLALPAPAVAGRPAWPARLLRRLLGAEPADGAPEPVRPRFRLLPGGRARARSGPWTGREPDREPGPEPEPVPAARPTVTDLYHSHRLQMVRLALLLVDDRSSAEDVVQDAFVALYKRHGERLDDVDNALGYLRTSVVNTARSVLRRRKTAREYVPPHEADAPSAEDHALLGDEHRRVLEALRGLTDRQREVLVLRYWSELTEAQIAETLGLSRGAVKSTASRALDALERVLRAQDR